MHNFILFTQEHFFVLLFIHTIITLIIAYYISLYALQRFDNTIRTPSKDVQRTNRIAQLFYKFSLHKYNQLSLFCFFIAFNFAIPFLGYILSFWIAWYLVHVEYKQTIFTTSVLDLNEFQNSFLVTQKIFGEGSMINLLNDPYIQRAKKIQALSVLAREMSPASLQIIKQSLTSQDDEIRMFGYATLNRFEYSINLRINENLEIINQEMKNIKQRNKAKIGAIAKELAFLYWELIYTEIFDESLKENFIRSSIVYLDIAKEYYLDIINELTEKLDKHKKDKSVTSQTIKQEQKKLNETYAICSTIFSHMGKVYMKKEKYELAKTEFTIAKELLPEQSTAIIPYLAEVYYRTKKFDIVKSMLTQASDLKLNIKLYPILMQWSRVS